MEPSSHGACERGHTRDAAARHRPPPYGHTRGFRLHWYAYARDPAVCGGPRAQAALADDQSSSGHTLDMVDLEIRDSTRSMVWHVGLPHPWRTAAPFEVCPLRTEASGRSGDASRPSEQLVSLCSTRLDERVQLAEILTLPTLTSSHPCLERRVVRSASPRQHDLASPAHACRLFEDAELTGHPPPHPQHSSLTRRSVGEGHGFVVVLGNDSRGLRSSEASEDEATFRAPRRLAAAPWRPRARERRVPRPPR